MPKRSSKKRPPADENEAAFRAVEALTGDQEPKPMPDEAEMRRRAAALLGSLGGKKGGPARARALSKKRRAEIAKKAAKTRWGRKPR